MSIVDSAFGELHFDALWCGQVNIAPYGNVEIFVEGSSKRPPTDRQREVYLQFQSLFPEYKGRLDQEILNYYLSKRETFLEYAIEPSEEVPEINTVAELDKIIESGPRIVVYGECGDDVLIKMRWSVTFDDEHGLAIEIENSEIVDVGPN